MDDHSILSETAEPLEPTELLPSLLVHTLRRMNDPGPSGRRPSMASPHLLLALEIERVRPAVAGYDVSGEFGRAQGSVERIVMCDGRRTGQQVLDAAEEEALGKRHCDRIAERARSPPRMRVLWIHSA